MKAIKDELRRRGYLPLVLDFEPLGNRDPTEMISLLARLSRFITADLTDSQMLPRELRGIIPNLSSVPVQPILQQDYPDYGMGDNFGSHPWFLEIHRCIDLDDLLPSFGEKGIEPAEAKAKELREMRMARADAEGEGLEAHPQVGIFPEGNGPEPNLARHAMGILVLGI